MARRPLVLWLLILALGAPRAWAGQKVEVAHDAALRRALGAAQPGSHIVIAPGKYSPGVSVRALAGTAERPIVIEGADPKNKPVFEGGRAGIHLSDCAHLVLRNMAVRGQSGNGINIDDGGTFDTPAHHVTLEGIDVSDIGPTGNRDAIKLSGIDDLIVRGCTIQGWGGQGIDMVGCHRALVERCAFRGKPGFGQQIGVQAKGGRPMSRSAAAHSSMRGSAALTSAARRLPKSSARRPPSTRPGTLRCRAASSSAA